MAEKIICALAQFDEDTSTKMNEIGRILRLAGFVGKQTPDIPYHITLGTFSPACEPDLDKRLQAICGSFERFNLSFNHIGLFGLEVLFLAPDVNRQLLDLHQSIQQPASGEHDWTPHATILIDEPEIIQSALPIVAEHFKSIRARVESVGLYEFWPTRFIAEYKLQ